MYIAAAALLAPALGCGDASSARETALGSGEATAASNDRAAASVEVSTGASRAEQGVRVSGALAAEATAGKVGSPPPAANAVVDATFDDIKFPMEKSELFQRSMLTAKVQSLFGKQIRIRGYMYPTLRKRGLTQFVLVRDNMECCFGPGAALFDCILVTMAPGKTAEYSIRPIAVEGAFRLEELPGPDGRPLAIYQMRGEGVATGG